MKKFNVKALSLAVAAAVVSSAAGAAERDLGSIPEKAQNAMAFQTVFGENTKFDEDTGKFTFDKDSSALLLKTMELEQAVNGFAAGSNFVATNEDGSKTVREATNADIEADSMKGVGLAGGITAVNTRVDNLAKDIDEALDEQDQTVEQLKAAITSNNEQIAKVSEDMAGMGKEISTKFDEVDSEISKASDELSGAIEKVSEDVTAVNTRVDSLTQDTSDAKAAAKAAEDKVTELSANVDSKVKEAKDAADKAVDAASKIDAVTEKADKASKGVEDLAKELEATQKAAAQAALATIENAQELNGFKEGDQIVVTKDDGSKVIRTATKEDVENDDLDGLGLKEVVAQHDASLYDLTETVNDNSEALVKTAEVVNAISADVTANKEAIKTKADKADVEAAQKAAAQAALATIENAQELNGFKEGDQIVVTKDDGSKAIRTATKEDVENDDLDGLGLKEVVAQHDASLYDLTDTVNENSEALVKTAEVVNAISADVNANKAALEEQKEANEGFNNAIASLDKDIGDLASAGKAAMEALEVNRQDIDANKAAIETKADKADFEELAKYTADMGKKVNDIGDEVTALSDATSAAITRQDKDIVDLAKGLQLAAEAVEDNRKDIDANKADIEIAKKAAVEAEKSAKSVQGSVEVAQKSAETAESHAKAAKTSADAANNVASAAQTAAAQAQDAVKANASQVAANKADIATLQTASNQHAAGIAKNSARIDSLDKNVANLRKETRQGLAAQAALSGLFQPYSVGKFNVTAALGGFKSDTAVAVGAGYRFNENFAAKAGLAVGTSSGSSASYNVGVNYEW
ncbi:YadA-like family protein [Neisseria sp. CP9]|uniref:YadA-like family protein n=1 Tax=Neisseria sp. CP9 TaxID=3388843 RepID=UPI0039F14A0A